MTPVWIALPLTLALALTGCGLQNYSTDGASPQACTALAAAQPAVSQIVNKANEVTVGDVRAHLLEVSAQLGQATSHSSGSAQQMIGEVQDSIVSAQRQIARISSDAPLTDLPVGFDGSRTSIHDTFNGVLAQLPCS